MRVCRSEERAQEIARAALRDRAAFEKARNAECNWRKQRDEAVALRRRGAGAAQSRQRANDGETPAATASAEREDATGRSAQRIGAVGDAAVGRVFEQREADVSR